MSCELTPSWRALFWSISKRTERSAGSSQSNCTLARAALGAHDRGHLFGDAAHGGDIVAVDAKLNRISDRRSVLEAADATCVPR